LSARELTQFPLFLLFAAEELTREIGQT